MRLRGAILALLMFPILQLSGQNVGQRPDKEVVSFKDRIAIRTNVVDWILTTPNIAFDYDVVNTPYDKKSIGINLKYNWDTNHTYVPKLVYNLFDLRLDYRFYWRQQPYDNRDCWGDWEREWINSTKGLGRLRARASSFRASENPRKNVSFFVGPYLSTSTFSIKLSATDDALGRQGIAYGGGLTAGIAMPLYGYKNGAAIDIELGGSLGWHFVSYDLYSVDTESNCYHSQGHHSKWMKYPLIADARVSLVYRFRTIAKQHKEVNYGLLDRRYIAISIKGYNDKVKEYNNGIKEAKDEIDKRNQDIALYKQTMESEEGFNTAYSLEHLTPYAYMMEVPRKYTRHDKDTLPKIEINNIEQITDHILLSVRASIDSIPHVTSAQIDDEFVKQYNSIINIGHRDKRAVYRSELIKSIYNRLNEHLIKTSNDKLISGTFSTEIHTEKVKKFDASSQKSPEVDVTYKDSVRTIKMSDNEKTEWRNSIKKKAWSDAQNRKKGIYTRRVEPIATKGIAELVATDSITVDSVKINSVKLDSIGQDSIDYNRTDTITTDSIKHIEVVTDSIAIDFTGMVAISYIHVPHRIWKEWEEKKLFICLKEEKDEE